MLVDMNAVTRCMVVSSPLSSGRLPIINGAESIIFDPEASHEFTVVETALDGTLVYDYERGDRILLQNPFDMLALWDEVVKHGTTPALIATADLPQGTRDMLLTFFSRRR